ncbi:MAG: helix-turn-helix transcriptional regulator [bacterium]|nr:helix-turn-helix transcriptional regulator [bacterium]
MNIGATAKRLRERLGITQVDCAKILGISNVHLCNVEKNKTQPSQALIEKYVETWGVDLYVLSWCEFGNSDELPVHVRKAAEMLSVAWERRIDALIAEHAGRVDECFTSET